MKYILSIGLLFLSSICFGQTFGFPSILPGNNKPQITINQGTVGVTTGFTWVTNYSDTTAANAVAFVKNQPGITIMVNGYELWMRDSLAKSWVLVGGGAVDNNQWFGIDAFATYKNGTLTTGTQNLAVGQNSLKLNIEGIGNTALGFSTLSNNDSSYNTAVGYTSMRQNLTGYFNTAIGANSLLTNTVGYRNTASGYNAQTLVTSGHDNTSSGANSLPVLTTGVSNTASGSNSLLAMTIGSLNTAIGDSVFYANVAGIGNVGVGYQVGSNTGGNYNVFLGYQAGNNVSQTATPINSIAIGYQSFTTASDQIVIGNSSHTDLRVYGIAPGEGTAVLKYDTVSKQFFYGSPAGVAANNGITDSSGRFILGGSLYKNTTINTQSYALIISTSESGVIPLQVASTDNNAINANSVDGFGVAGVSTNSAGVTGGSTTSYGGVFQSAGSLAAIQAKTFGSDLNTITPALDLFRVTSGTPAAGMGQSIDFRSYLSNFSTHVLNQIISEMTNATEGTRSSQLYITGVNSAATEYYANFQTAGIVRVNNLADTLSTKAYVRQFNASLGNTIYSADDAITTDRTVDLDGNTLSFSESGNFMLRIHAVDGSVTAQTPSGRIVQASDDDSRVRLYNDANNYYDITSAGHNIVGTNIFLASTLAGTSTGYVWTLQNTTTGEGAWAAVPGGGGAAWNGITAPTGSLSLAFDDAEVSVFTNGSNAETFFTTTSNSLTTGIVNLWQTSSITSGSLATFTSTSTASNGFSLVNINSSGVNASASRTSIGLTISVTNTGTTPTNVGFAVTANTNVLTPSTDNSTTLVINSAAAAARLQFGTLVSTTTSGAIYGPVGASSSNYGLALGATQTNLNAVTDLELRIGATVVANVFANGVGIGIGAVAPTSTFDVQSITEQQRIRYDASNYYSTTVSSTGAATFNAVGSGSSFRFSDIVHLGTAASTLGQLTFNGNTSGTVTMQSAAAAGTWTFTLPTTDGANDYDYMVTNGSGVTRWEAGFNKTVQTLTDAVSITWNVNSGGNAVVTLGAAGRTLAITNAVAGYTYTIRIVQDGTGNRTITTWPTNTKWPNNGTAPTLSTTPGRYDFVTFYYDGTNFYGNYNFDYQ